ncbi:uncharacterized protein LOC144027763 [Festucalex cinctus]
MCKVRILRKLVKQRLNVAVEEIFELYEKTIAEYEEELCRTKEENKRQRDLLRAVLEPTVRLHKEDVQPVLQEDVPSEVPAAEELQALEEDADIHPPILTDIDVITEEAEGQSSQLEESERKQSPQMTTEADEDVQSEPDSLFAPLSDVDDMMSHSDINSEQDPLFAPLSDVDVMPDLDHTYHTKKRLMTKKKPKVDQTYDGDYVPFEQKRKKTMMEKCPECGKACKRLREHMLTHTGEKPFTCLVCGRGFSVKQNMKRHMSLHTGERPHSCSLCPKRYYSKTDLKRHSISHKTKTKNVQQFSVLAGLVTARHTVSALSSYMQQVLAESQQDIACEQQCSSIVEQEEPGEAPHIKEEEANGLQEADVVTFTWTGLTVKIEDDEGQSLQLHPSPSENRGSNSSQADGEPPTINKKSKGEHSSENKHLSCSQCGRTFAYKSALKMHMITHSGEKPFACSVCGKSFSFKQNMSRHVAIHTGEKPFSCSVCEKRFFSKFELRRHMSTHNTEKAFSCSVCTQRFYHGSHLRLHMKTHTGEKLLASGTSSQHIATEADGKHCEEPHSKADDSTSHSSEADYSDDSKEALESKKKPDGDATHQDNYNHFNCSVCGKKFAYKSYLKSHMMKHSGEKPFACSICDKRFSTKRSMMRHAAMHTDANRNTCSVCAMTFPNKFEMKKHRSTHASEKSFLCSVCAKSFSHKSYLRQHMKSHSAEKPFTCPVCGRGFSHRPYLKIHMVTHTREKAFTCSVCSKSFSHRSYLGVHMRTHTGEKPFPCPVCAKSFSQSSCLRQHMVTHTGEKPFNCSLCAKSYSHRSHLKQHMLTHGGKKPFTCPVCDKSLSSSAYLRKHLQKHNSKEPLASGGSTSEADGEQADDNAAPLSDLDDVMSNASDADHVDNTEEPLEMS